LHDLFEVDIFEYQLRKDHAKMEMQMSSKCRFNFFIWYYL